MEPKELNRVRGFAMKYENDEGEVILVQSFFERQSLARSPRDFIAFTLSTEETYTRLTSGFSLAGKLVCIVENERLKFRSLHALKRIMDTSEIFRAATDSEVFSFVDGYSEIIEVSDMDNFLQCTDAPSRKLISSLAKENTLENKDVQVLREEAEKTGLVLELNNGKIVVPQKSRDIKNLLLFLNDGRYVGPVSGKAYITNSRKTAD